MDKLNSANKRLKTAHENLVRDYSAQTAGLEERERRLLERLGALDRKKAEAAATTGNVDAAGSDVLEINAGGRVVAAKRSTLTQLKGTRLEALFSGRWDKILQRDGAGRIFLDVNPVGFQAIVDHLNELAISPEDDPPGPPSVDEENSPLLCHQLELFGIMNIEIPDSNIVKTVKQAEYLHDWLDEEGSDGELILIYRGSRDGMTSRDFHYRCDNKGATLTIVKTDTDFIIGGYSDVSWRGPKRSSSGGLVVAHGARRGPGYKAANTFLFALSGSTVPSPFKMMAKDRNETQAVYHSADYGPTFGMASHRMGELGLGDFVVSGSNVILGIGHAFEHDPFGPGSVFTGTCPIQEIEVFQVQVTSTSTSRQSQRRKQNNLTGITKVERFSDDINDAINSKLVSLAELESEIIYLEKCFDDESAFVTSFASGDSKDIVSLNVSGTLMVTRRSALCTARESVLAQQFDDSKWTEQGCNNRNVKEWTPDEVASWVRKIEGVPDEISGKFTENGITGRELLVLKKDGLAMLGITRTGTLCLLSEEIETLRAASQDVVTLIEHSPYCFGKILDYLRLKYIQSKGLMEEPAQPKVCESQRKRFEKVVKYFFPGDGAKFILG